MTNVMHLLTVELERSKYGVYLGTKRVSLCWFISLTTSASLGFGYCFK